MNQIRRNMLLGCIFVLICGTLAHFAYEWLGRNFIAGLFFPVNESVWEHMKLIFFPMLLCVLFLNRHLKQDTPCITTALSAGLLLGTWLIPCIFYAYTNILGYNTLLLDIATFMISVVLAFLSAYYLTITCKAAAWAPLLKLLVIVQLLLFWVFTYAPPSLPLFLSKG